MITSLLRYVDHLVLGVRWSWLLEIRRLMFFICYQMASVETVGLAYTYSTISRPVLFHIFFDIFKMLNEPLSNLPGNTELTLL